jgi:hypothetical protein
MFQHLDIMEKDLLHRLQAKEGGLHNQKLYTHPILNDLESDAKKILEGTRTTR